jgi:hypothetical protein
MALVGAVIDEASLTLFSDGFGDVRVRRTPDPGSPTVRVRVWKSEGLEAEDCGAEPAEWLSRVIGTRCRLVRIGAGFRRPVRPGAARPGDLVAFADAFPFLVVTRASLDDLNPGSSRKGARRFRWTGFGRTSSWTAARPLPRTPGSGCGWERPCPHRRPVHPVRRDDHGPGDGGPRGRAPEDPCHLPARPDRDHPCQFRTKPCERVQGRFHPGRRSGRGHRLGGTISSPPRSGPSNLASTSSKTSHVHPPPRPYVLRPRLVQETPR